MTEDEQLAAALADHLQAIVSEIEPSDRLREWVRTELRTQPRERRTPKRSRRRLRALAILTPTTAAAAAIIALIVGTQATPSFAVVRTPGGLVRVTLNDVEGVSGANAKLRRLGVANVAVVPVKAGCRSRAQLVFTGIGPGQGSTTISIDPHQIPTHMTDVLAATPLPSGDVALGLGRVSGRAPACVAPARSGFGIPAQPRSSP